MGLIRTKSEIIQSRQTSTSSHEVDGVDLQEQAKSNQVLRQGQALHQVFGQDVLVENGNKAPLPQAASTAAASTLTSSLWSKVIGLFKKSDLQEISQVDPSTSPEMLVEDKPQPINPVPFLEPPTHIPDDLKMIKLTKPQKKSDIHTRLLSKDIEEALLVMNKRPIEAILFNVLMTQSELEKEHAVVAEGTYTKYLDFQKKQQELLLEIKEVIVKDENVNRIFGTAKNIALFATFVAGAISVAATYGAVAPVWAGFSTATTAGLAALTQAGGSYFQRCLDEHKASHENYTHHDRYYSDRSDVSRDRLLSIAETDTALKKVLGDLLKRSNKMREFIHKK